MSVHQGLMDAYCSHLGVPQSSFFDDAFEQPDMATGQTVEAEHPLLPAWTAPRAKLEPAGTDAQPIDIPDSPIQAPISSVEMETDDETFALTFDTTDLVARALAVLLVLLWSWLLVALAP